MAEQCEYKNNSINFTDWEIKENGDGHLHFNKNTVQKFQIGNDGVEAGDIVYDNTTSGLTSTDLQSAIDEEETQIQQTQQQGTGSSLKLVYNWNSGTSGNPSSGKLLLDNSTYSIANNLHIHNQEKLNSLDVRNLLLLGTGKLNIYLQKYNDASKYALFNAEGINSSNNDYIIFQNLTYLQGSGTFSDGKKVICIIAKQIGTELKGIQIPSLPTNAGNVYSLRYDVDNNSFSWHQEN